MLCTGSHTTEKKSSICARKALCIKSNNNIQSQRLVSQSQVFQNSWSVHKYRRHSLTCSEACGYSTGERLSPKVSCYGSLYIWNSRGFTLVVLWCQSLRLTLQVAFLCGIDISMAFVTYDWAANGEENSVTDM
jgi:hypothetical protein